VKVSWIGGAIARPGCALQGDQLGVGANWPNKPVILARSGREFAFARTEPFAARRMRYASPGRLGTRVVESYQVTKTLTIVGGSSSDAVRAQGQAWRLAKS